MKKILLLSAVVFASTAIAGDLNLGVKEFQMGKKAYAMEYKSVAATPSKGSSETLAGTYVGAAITEDPVNSCGSVVIESAGGNAYTVKGAHLGLPNAAVEATFADGKLTIPAGQQVYNHSTYGPASLFGIDAANNLVDVVLTLNEDGSLVADSTLSVAMLLTTGTYAGYALGDTYFHYSFMKANGTISYEGFSSGESVGVETYNTCVTVDMDAEGNVSGGVVYGFDDMTWLPFTVTEGNKVQFSADKVYYYSSSYGLASAVDLDEDNRFYPAVGPTGTIDIEAGQISMPHWTFILPSGDGTKYYFLNNEKKNAVITFPAISVVSIDSVKDNATVKAVKVLRDGKLFIESNGMSFNAAGQLVK